MIVYFLCKDRHVSFSFKKIPTKYVILIAIHYFIIYQKIYYQENKTAIGLSFQLFAPVHLIWKATKHLHVKEESFDGYPYLRTKF